MNKSEAVRIISKCANIYKKRLDGYQIVFVYRDENNQDVYKRQHYICRSSFLI